MQKQLKLILCHLTQRIAKNNITKANLKNKVEVKLEPTLQLLRCVLPLLSSEGAWTCTQEMLKPHQDGENPTA